MCIVYLKKNPSPNIKLLIVSNRDEFYNRPYENITAWDNGIIAGKDLKNNGTWLGFNKTGNFAFVTNYRMPQNQEDQFESRGYLVSNYLESKVVPNENELKKFRPFNLIYGDINNFEFISNIQKKKISPGLNRLCLSNGKLEDRWHKMHRLETLISEINLNQDISNLKDQIFNILGDQQKAEIANLPSTGLTVEQEQLISSIFIQSPKYGTVTQNISLVDSNNMLYMFENDVRDQTSKTIKIQLEYK